MKRFTVRNHPSPFLRFEVLKEADIPSKPTLTGVPPYLMPPSNLIIRLLGYPTQSKGSCMSCYILPHGWGQLQGIRNPGDFWVRVIATIYIYIHMPSVTGGGLNGGGWLDGL